MRRSGAFTLAVVLTLGAVSGGRGQELSSSVTPANGSLDGFVLPSVPENWADLPFKLTASQNVSYNSNISSFPIGVAPKGAILGDFTSATNFGFQTRANVSGQQVFLDATFGVIRYLHEVQSNSTVYSLNAGVNWNVTSRCSGTLATSLSKSPAQLTEQVGTGINYTTTTALNETGKCAVSNGYSLVFNSGLTTLTNSDPTNAVNNSRTALIAAGIEYAKGYSTLTALASNSNANFSNRSGVLGLATETDFHSFTLNYTRQINPNLSVSGTHRPGWGHERIQLGSAQNAPPDLYDKRDVDAHAQAQPERVRVTINRSSDDGHRQRAAELQCRNESELSADPQGRHQRWRVG